MSATTRINAALLASSLLLVGCGSADRYQGLSAEQLLQQATQEYQEEEWDNAARALERLLASYGTSDLIVQARLMLGHTYYAKGDYLTARSEYTRFLDRFAGHPDAPEAAVGSCRSLVALSPEPQRDQGYTLDAMSTCRNVVVDYAGTPQAEEAAQLANEMRLKLAEKDYLSAEFYYRRKLYDSAIIYFQDVAARYPETEWAPKALLGVYESNVAIGYEDEAEEARTRLLEMYPDSEAAQSVRTNGASS